MHRLRLLALMTIFLLLGLADLLGWPDLVYAQVVDCNRCHGDAEFLVGKGDSREHEARLLVPDSHLFGSAHDSLSCGSCHVGYDDAFPHQPGTSTVACAGCHEDQQELWHASIHGAGYSGQSDSAGEGMGTVEGVDTPDCARCHSVHRILSSSDRESPTHPLNEAALCSECHNDARIIETYFSDPADSVGAHAAAQYHETVHGLAIRDAGLTVSATCSDCHRPHLVLPSDEERSSVHRDNVATTCGDCHLGVLETFEASAHGKALREASHESEHEPPVCTTCHSSHGVVAPDDAWRADVIEECGNCHEHLYETYFDTHHGKVTRLGGPLVAKCSDCHSAHANLPADDPNSTVHAANLVATCGECHSGASPSFVQYFAHADHHDRESYPQLFFTYLFMTSLLVGVFTFFGAHSVLWLVRSAFDRGDSTEEKDKDESAKGDSTP